MSHLDTKTYNKKNLKDEDREIINMMDSQLFASVLGKNIVGMYLKENFGIKSKSLEKLCQEILEDYADFQKKRFDAFKLELMASMIDSYEDDSPEEETETSVIQEPQETQKSNPSYSTWDDDDDDDWDDWD